MFTPLRIIKNYSALRPQFRPLLTGGAAAALHLQSKGFRYSIPRNYDLNLDTSFVDGSRNINPREIHWDFLEYIRSLMPDRMLMQSYDSVVMMSANEADRTITEFNLYVNQRTRVEMNSSVVCTFKPEYDAANDSKSLEIDGVRVLTLDNLIRDLEMTIRRQRELIISNTASIHNYVSSGRYRADLLTLHHYMNRHEALTQLKNKTSKCDEI